MGVEDEFFRLQLLIWGILGVHVVLFFQGVVSKLGGGFKKKMFTPIWGRCLIWLTFLKLVRNSNFFIQRVPTNMLFLPCQMGSMISRTAQVGKFRH